MAQKVQILLTDDIDGTEAVETVTFSLDGKTYEIDLNEKNAGKLRKSLEPYVGAGRRQKSAPGVQRKRSASTGGDSDTAAIRAWAKENGYNVNDRGRVPADVREAYNQAH